VTHRGPCQPRTFCDSVLCLLLAVAPQLGAGGESWGAKFGAVDVSVPGRRGSTVGERGVAGCRSFRFQVRAWYVIDIAPTTFLGGEQRYLIAQSATQMKLYNWYYKFSVGMDVKKCS